MFAMLFSSPGVLLFTKHFTIYIFFYGHAVFGKTKTLNPMLKTPKSRIPMFGKTKIHNSYVWKSQNTEF